MVRDHKDIPTHIFFHEPAILGGLPLKLIVKIGKETVYNYSFTDKDGRYIESTPLFEIALRNAKL